MDAGADLVRSVRINLGYRLHQHGRVESASATYWDLTGGYVVLSVVLFDLVSAIR